MSMQIFFNKFSELDMNDVCHIFHPRIVFQTHASLCIPTSPETPSTVQLRHEQRGNRLDSKDLLWENWHCWYFLLQPSRCTVRIKDLCTAYIPWYWIFSLRATTLWKFRFYWVVLKLQLQVEEFCIINFLLCFLFFVCFFTCKKKKLTVFGTLFVTV